MLSTIHRILLAETTFSLRAIAEDVLHFLTAVSTAGWQHTQRP